jgi:peptidoglycan/xylan/chitin deacetylase (PgdA/CDA1 family)
MLVTPSHGEADRWMDMSRRSTNLLRAGLSALHFSGADGILAPLTRGIGACFMLHHVRPEQPDKFHPNRILSVTPQFLDSVIRQVIETGFDVVSLDEAHFRLAEGDFERPFVCFTFDDGYKDNAEHAYPIFKRYGLPFAIYAPSDFMDGAGDLWWLSLEHCVGRVTELTVNMDGSRRTFRCASASEKDSTYHRLYWWLRSIDEQHARRTVRELCRATGFNSSTQCADLVMDWDELRALASDPLVTIGGHTRRHLALAKLTPAQAKAEMEDGIRRLELELGRPIRHFSYPYGDVTSAGPREFAMARELGMKTAVTTRKGLFQREHAEALTALPRVSLNGDFQKARYVKVMLNGAPFALLDMVNRLTARRAASW